MNLNECAQEVHHRLLEKYGEPSWRDPLPILDQLIQTILSQNTNDINSDLAFAKLKRAYDTWGDVRNADEGAVIEAIRSAGLANQKGPHIQRVTGRIGLRPEEMSNKQAHRHLAELFPPDTYKSAHLNIIRLGREVCHPRHPACDICVLQSLCDYFQKSQNIL